MTAAARACAAAILATALAVALAGAVYVVPGHQSGAGREVGRNAPSNGYPMVRAALPRGAVTPQVSNITSAGSLNWAGYAVSRAATTFPVGARDVLRPVSRLRALGGQVALL
jgi:hypothetical protein